MTIRTRLALWYTGLLTIIILIFSVTVFTVTRAANLNTIDQILDSAASDLIDTIVPVASAEADADEPGVPTQVEFLSEDVFRTPGISIQVWKTRDASGPIEPRLVRASTDVSDQSEPLNAAALAEQHAGYTSRSIHHNAVRVVSRPFHLINDSNVGNGSAQHLEVGGVVQVAISIEALEQSTQALLVVILIASVISIVVAVGLGLRFSDRALQPIDDITRAASTIANAEDLATRLQWNGPYDELGQLARMFNHMMGRLEHLFSVQQRFVADVSHELRTPLTSIVGNVEIIKRYGMDQSSLDAIHREAERMSRMVNDLLLLSRADYGEMKVDLYPLDLDAVVLEVYELAHVQAQERGIKLVLERLEPMRIRGNADRIKQLLLNLLGNALKFTERGGTVSFAVYREDEHAILTVSDTGIGISPEDLKRIFDRFFQADNSRVHRSDSDGSGLGLSIAKWVVDVHQGSIDVTSELGQGTHFRIALPLVPQTDTKKSPDDEGNVSTRDTGRVRVVKRGEQDAPTDSHVKT